MLKIRLQRIGRKNEPHFRVVVTDAKNGPKSGRFVDVIGSYNPKLGETNIDTTKAQEWIDSGAQVSDTVYNMLIDAKVIDGQKKNVLPKKSPTKKRNAPDEEPEPEAPAAEAETPKEEAPAEEAAATEEPAPEETPVADEVPVEESKKEEA